MGTKPTQDPKWVTTDDPLNIIEPSSALKTNGVVSGGIWGREHLNWMFNSISKWIDYIRTFVLDKDNSLSELTDKPQAFANIKQAATTTSTGVVEKATSTEMSTGTEDKFPDAATIKGYYGDYREETLNAPSGNMITGSCKVVRMGSIVCITGSFTHTSDSTLSTSSGFLPSWARPSDLLEISYFIQTTLVYPPDGMQRTVSINPNGRMSFTYMNNSLELKNDTTTVDFSVSYVI